MRSEQLCWAAGVGGEPRPGIAGAGNDGSAINAISACVAGSAGIAGKDGGAVGRGRFWASGRWCWRWEGLVVLLAIAGPRRYQGTGLRNGRSLATLSGLGSGGGVAVAVTATGEEAFNDVFEAGHALIGKGRGGEGREVRGSKRRSSPQRSPTGNAGQEPPQRRGRLVLGLVRRRRRGGRGHRDGRRGLRWRLRGGTRAHWEGESTCVGGQGLGHGGIPHGAVATEGVADHQELAHAGDEGHLGRLAGGDEALIEGLEVGVAAGGRQGGHVERGAHLGAPAPAAAAPAPGAAVAIEGRDPDQGGDLLAGTGPQFGALRPVRWRRPRGRCRGCCAARRRARSVGSAWTRAANWRSTLARAAVSGRDHGVDAQVQVGAVLALLLLLGPCGR